MLPVELSINHLDWEMTWRRVRAKGVISEHCSTLLMSLHDWLPSHQRVLSMRGVKDPGRMQCRVCGRAIESTYHILAQCSSSDAAQALLSWIKKLAPNALLFDVLYLNVALRPGSHEEAAISILTAMAVHYIWINRDRGGISAWSLKSEVFAQTAILMNSKFSACAKVIHSIIC